MVWSLYRPVITIAIYSLVFTYFIPLKIPSLVFFLMVGTIHWNFFAQTLLGATGCVLDNASLLKKVPFPAEILPLATVSTHLVQYVLMLLIFFPASFLWFGIFPTWNLLFFIPLFCLQVTYLVGLSFFLGAATVRMRDVRHFVDILLFLLFWMTPVVYELRAIPPPLRTLIEMNPFTPVIVGYQEILCRGAAPSVETWPLSFGWAVSFLAIGWLTFRRHSWRFAEEA